MLLISRIRNLFQAKRLINPNLNYRCLFSKNEHFLKNPSSTIIVKRQKSLIFWFTKRSVEELKTADNVPSEFTLIYRNVMTKYIYLAQNIGLITTTILCVMFVFQDNNLKVDRTYQPWSDTVRATEGELIFYVTAFMGMLISLQILLSRLPVRIYRIPRSSKYVFVFHRKVPIGIMKTYSCKIGEVAPVEPSGALPWKYNRFIIKNTKPVILFDQYFRRPADFSIMLGEQKDTDDMEK